jgi:hypothetical protein
MRALLVLLVLVGCSSPPYLCTTPTDMSGRGIALCRAASQTPVCDATGMTASYVMGSLGGYVLQGGTIALCDSSNQVVCADRTVLPHCIAQPSSP